MKQLTECSPNTHARCMAVVEECNATLRWDLDGNACQRYACAISTLLADTDDDRQISIVAANYHADDALVAALRNAADANHERAWAQWMRQVLTILHHEGLDWSSDHGLDTDDLAQIARAELVRALPNYRYQSRFGVWAARVVVQIIRRHIRDSQRAKRAVRPTSLEQLTEQQLAPDPYNDAEASVQGRLLYELIMRILAEQPDQRLGRLFHLAMVEDRRVAEIGALVHLHPSRVRALLQQIRQLLSSHPALLSWRDADRSADSLPGAPARAALESAA